MSASPLKFFNAAAPVPRVVLLPDHLFFVRAIPIAEAATPADVAAQVELALETLSPFPPAQLYHGYHWVSGSPHALVFAAYRKRFSTEQIETWAHADLVAPTFATLFAAEFQPATTVVIPTADGLTAVYWEQGAVPTRVATRLLPAEATEEERTQARDELIRAFGGSRQVENLETAPAIEASTDEQVLAFRAGAFETQLPVALSAALDVRDKEALAALRRERNRDLLLWRTFAACAALLAVLLVGEIAIIGGKIFLDGEKMKVAAQQPNVDKIMTANELATRIEDRATKRLLPIEMILAVGSRKDRSGILGTIQFTSSKAVDLSRLEVRGQASNANDVDAYRIAVSQLDPVENVEVVENQTNRGITTFRLLITFKPGALTPMAAI